MKPKMATGSTLFCKKFDMQKVQIQIGVTVTLWHDILYHRLSKKTLHLLMSKNKKNKYSLKSAFITAISMQLCLKYAPNWQLPEFCKNMFYVFSPWKLGQIRLPITVLEYTHQDVDTPYMLILIKFWLTY